jgi:hypothetical protein
MATKIVTKNSSTASAVPTASDLVQGELAVNVADKRLFTEDNGGSIIELGTNPSTIDINAGSIDGATIGASSASTGAFTTLTASGAFTSVGIDDNATSTAITIDSSENVGIGVVPESWTYFSPLQAKRSSFAGSDGQTGVGYNWYFDGAYKYIANDYALAYQQNATSGVHSWSTAASGTAGATATLTERMRIDSSGNVGIGTSSPSALIDLGTSTGQKLLMYASSNIKYGMSIESSEYRMFAEDQAVLTFGHMARSNGTSYTERMRIDSSGRLLVGKTSASATGLGTELRGSQIIIGKTSSGTVNGIYFNHNSSYVGGLNYTNTATSVATSSDQRLKENIADADDAGSKIDSIQVRKFDWKEDNSHQEYGFIAQELEQVFAYAVHTAQNEMQTKSVDYASLVPMMLKEIQSLRNRVAQLEE